MHGLHERHVRDALVAVELDTHPALDFIAGDLVANGGVAGDDEIGLLTGNRDCPVPFVDATRA